MAHRNRGVPRWSEPARLYRGEESDPHGPRGAGRGQGRQAARPPGGDRGAKRSGTPAPALSETHNGRRAELSPGHTASFCRRAERPIPEECLVEGEDLPTNFLCVAGRVRSGKGSRGRVLTRGPLIFMRSADHREIRCFGQPSALAECRKINSGRRIPSRRAVSGTKLHRNILVAVRNPQLRPRYRIRLGGSRRSGIGPSFAFPRPLCWPRRLRR